MPVHVNEYDPRAKDPTRGIQSDARKLKFNNIQSCIACIVCIHGQAGGMPVVSQLVGVHFNTINMNNSEIELNIALSQIKQLYPNALLDIYLVGAYDMYYASTGLARKLRYLQPRQILLANLAAPPRGGANKDVKAEVAGAGVHIYQRDCVRFQPGTLKDKYDPAKGGVAMTAQQFAEGRHAQANDRDAKPWQRITQFRAL